MEVRTLIQISREVEILERLLESPEIREHKIWQIHGESARFFLVNFAESQNFEGLESMWARVQKSTVVEPGIVVAIGWLVGDFDACPSSIIANQIGGLDSQ